MTFLIMLPSYAAATIHLVGGRAKRLLPGSFLAMAMREVDRKGKRVTFDRTRRIEHRTRASSMLTAWTRRPAHPMRMAAVQAEIDQIVHAADTDLSVHQRIDAWRMWPERYFPRTHLLKVRRDPIRASARADIPLAVKEEPGVVESADVSTTASGT